MFGHIRDFLIESDRLRGAPLKGLPFHGAVAQLPATTQICASTDYAKAIALTKEFALRIREKFLINFNLLYFM